ncbi:WD repeat-containing protein [Plectosphaerella plurivora]|uniref:WD repeat-containing protein n=1 Tax=Plectosphaerella plurivora TaxID=936078 RepID=A0A9P8VMS3_9PEZI|nr:WD repeat-containing protein [Plectosphaerella plurivora]
MPSFDQTDPPKKGKIIKSAFDSESFDADVSFHVDGLVGSATISPSGRDVALASPDGLAIIDLDSPYNPPRRLSSHGLPWLVTDVQWSPFAARDYWVVSTANHRALVWNLNLRDDSSSGAIEHSLQGHSRAITDINFSAHHPDLLATCAVDGYVHCWDLRRPRQPVLTFCDWFAGATQVKYNRQDPHIMASSHDRWLHIWDERKAYVPLKSVCAHTSKIYGLDWNRTRSTGIVTCSLDKTIKFWDIGNEEDVPERTIRTDFPVWRARHTPFGRGVLAMPQNEPGTLYLYDRRVDTPKPADGRQPPVATFTGHGNNKAKEFLWRSRGGIKDDGTDHRDFQLVSWGEDNMLRLQRIDAATLEAVGYKKGHKALNNMVLTRKGAAYKTFRTVEDAVNRDRRSATMSDPRPSSGGTGYRQSALTLSMRSASSPYSGKVNASWKGPSMKAKSSHRRLDRSQAHIGWMKGITMTKRKSTSAGLKGAEKTPNLFSPNYPEDDKWGEPDSIQEEILRVSTQLPKVKWEHIDIDNLTLNASLNGPWGVDGESIFVKIKVDIPTNYPKYKAPKFFVEKTSFMPYEIHKKIEHELHQLAHRFLERRKHCLDVAFSYLLGDVDLETSTTFFSNVKDLDDEIVVLSDESSSEDDDVDIPAGGSASMSQELTASTEFDNNNTLAGANRPNMPPPPRLCGARFSNDGRLVCFFPSREEKAKAPLFAPTESLKERPKGEPFFGGFGKLGYDSSPRRDNHDDGSSSSSSDSDDSDTSTSSDDSEGTSIHRTSIWYGPSQRFRRTWSENRSIRSSGGGTGVGTGTGTGSMRRRPGGKPKNILSLHDISDKLPAKKELAREYAIFGDGADVCEQNAAVAERHGHHDLVNIWRYLALLLRKDIPLEPLDPEQAGHSILVVAQRAVSGHEGRRGDLSGRVKWGNHPLARGVIDDLFDYFERAADVQMLAMLSCIFGESWTADGVAYAESHLTQPETPMPMKAPAFSLEYFPTDASLWAMNGRSHSNSAITTPRTIHTPIHYSGSQCSDDILWAGDPGSNSYSCGETPPTRHRDYLGEAGQTQSLSTSPSNRIISRVNSGLTSSFAINFPRTFTANTAPSSPPNHPAAKKRPSPAETILSTLAPSAVANVTWGGSTIMGDTGTARTSISDDEMPGEDSLSLVPVAVHVHLEDQTIFDDDGWMSTPLLEPSRQNMYAGYRYIYAEILHMWDQPLARLEIMKFNVLKDVDALEGGHAAAAAAAVSSQPHGSSPILLGKKEQLQSLITSGRGLDVTGMCRVHETQLEPLKYTTASAGHLGGAVGVCDRCRHTQAQLLCVYCREPVDALYQPCLGCGCASHEGCLAEWHAAGEELCPAGDECNCVEEAMNGKIESWAAIMAAVRKGQQAPSPTSQRGLIGSMLPPPALDGDHPEGGDKEWERVDGHGAASGAGAVMSAARLSLGNRLKKAGGDWSRASNLRRKDDGSANASWRTGARS